MVLSNDYAGCQRVQQLGGTVNDGSRMEITCQKLGFAVYRKHNFTQVSLVNIIDEAKRMIFPPSYKRLIFVFAGHGNEKGQIITSEEKMVTVQDIILDLSKSDRLKCMAKIFLFDACRGDQDDHGRIMPVPRGGDNAHTIRVPENASNFLVAYSTIDGYRSYEETGGGIWMQCIAEKLLVVDKSIMDVLTVVNKEMSDKFQDREYSFQTPEFISRLNEDVNLFSEAAKAIPPVQESPVEGACTSFLTPPLSELSRNTPNGLIKLLSVPYEPPKQVPPIQRSVSDDSDLLQKLHSFKKNGIICDFSATDSYMYVSIILNDREKSEVHFSSKKQGKSALYQAVDFLSTRKPPTSSPPVGQNPSLKGIRKDQYVNQLHCYIRMYHKDKPPLPTYADKQVSEQMFVFTLEHELFGTITGNPCKGKSCAKQNAAGKAILYLQSTQQWK